MYRKIVVPIDIGHVDKLEKALATSAGFAKHCGAELHYLGVTVSDPSSVAQNPIEFDKKFRAFADEQASKRGIEIKVNIITNPGGVLDLDHTIMKTSEELDADLVIIASHVPGFKEYIVDSNAGYVARHSKISVFVVR